MSRAALEITGYALWAPGYREPRALIAERRDEAVTRPDAALLPARLRRRTSLTTRMAAEVSARAMAAAGCASDQIGVVLASAYGEIQTTSQLLSALADAPREPLSPVRFHNSVHNTATGYLSIACANRGFNTALASGRESAAMALLEASVALSTGRCAEVLVVVVEESLPELLASSGGVYDPLGAALVLRLASEDRSSLGARLERGVAAGARAQHLPERLAANPCAAALRVIMACARAAAGASIRVPLPCSETSGWTLAITGATERGEIE